MEGLKRGALVAVASEASRWMAVVVQSDHFLALPTVAVLRISEDLIDAGLLRIPLAPDAHNGLQKPAQVMIDTPATVPKERIAAATGRLDEVTMREISRALLRFFALV